MTEAILGIVTLTALALSVWLWIVTVEMAKLTTMVEVMERRLDRLEAALSTVKPEDEPDDGVPAMWRGEVPPHPLDRGSRG